MTYRVGKLWAVKAHKHIRYFLRRPCKRSVAKVIRLHRRLANV